MARPTKNVDINLLFPQFNMLPGPAGKRFQRDLLLHGGKTDTQGFSISDCFLRIDAGESLLAGDVQGMPPTSLARLACGRRGRQGVRLDG